MGCSKRRLERIAHHVQPEHTLRHGLTGMYCAGYFSSKAEKTYMRAVAAECVQDWPGYNVPSPPHGTSSMFFSTNGECQRRV